MSYLTSYLSGKTLNETVERIEKQPDLELDSFDTIAVRGNSGLLMGSILAAHWNKDLIIIRKTIDGSHSSNIVEGWGMNQKILIVDDFICSGGTMNIIHQKIMEVCDSPTIVGILLYAHTDFRTDKYVFTFEDDTSVPMWRITRGKN